MTKSGAGCASVVAAVLCPSASAVDQPLVDGSAAYRGRECRKLEKGAKPDFLLTRLGRNRGSVKPQRCLR